MWDLEKYLRTHGLDAMAAGSRTVRAVFELSYRELDADQQREYRLLALHPGSVITPGSAAALTGHTPAAAQMMLESLLDENLIQQRGPHGYDFHDLLRAYARDLAAEHEDGTAMAGSYLAELTLCRGVLDRYFRPRAYA